MIGRQQVVGIDFSGARDAGNKIWIATGILRDSGVEITSCFPARDLPNAGSARELALPALVDYIAGETEAVFGLDFPFSLPADLIGEATWELFVAAFNRRFASADEFRSACNAATGGRELKRRTDVEARVPFCVYNLRLYRQTFEGITNVLYPLIRERRAIVIPLQQPRPGLPTIAEICPASLLKAEGLYWPYKGRTPKHRQGRLAIIRRLAERGLLHKPARRLHRVLVDDPGGDALDGAIAAIGAARAIRDPACTAPVDALEAIECRVFY